MTPATTRASLEFTPDSPQGIFINRAPSVAWHQRRPEEIDASLFRAVLEGVGVRGDASARRQLGLSFILSYLNGDRAVLTETVQRLLSLSEQLDVPLLLALDGQNWWDGRPDLWNWWDPKQPGFDPRNVENVEWTDPGPEHAVKVCWRNWGRQLRVRPAPNLMSPRFREASRVELEHFAALIKAWAHKLPASKRRLFPGIKIGWEASIGINAFHYPNGNHYFETSPDDESADPKYGHDMKKDFAAGLVPLGYSALASEALKPKNHRVTLADHERIVANYLQFLATTCRGVGYAPDQLFLHSGGQYAPWELHYSHKVPITPDGVPGYSLYNKTADEAGDLGTSLEAAGRSDWCVAEWLTHAKTADGWKTDLNRSLNFRHCRSLTIYNWENVSTQPHAVEGIRQALAEAPRS